MGQRHRSLIATAGVGRITTMLGREYLDQERALKYNMSNTPDLNRTTIPPSQLLEMRFHLYHSPSVEQNSWS
jgi:hypothetical protein